MILLDRQMLTVEISNRNLNIVVSFERATFVWTTEVSFPVLSLTAKVGLVTNQGLGFSSDYTDIEIWLESDASICLIY